MAHDDGGESLESAFQQLKEMLSGATLRAVMGIVDAGNVVLAKIGDDSGDGHEVHQSKRDVWVRFTDVLSGMSRAGRLFVPAGILFARAKKGAGAHVVQGRNMNGPGGPLVMVDGGDGAADNVVPDWFGEDDAGIYGEQTMHVESAEGDVEIKSDKGDVKVEAPGSGKKVLLGSGSRRRVARLNDDTDCGQLQATFGIGPLVTCIVGLTYIAPDGTTTAVTSATPLTILLKGRITTASTKTETE
jgi:hypothetical protein